MERYAVYILASRRNGTLYIGVASNLVQRISQHNAPAVPEFTRKYGVTLAGRVGEDQLAAPSRREIPFPSGG